MPYKIRVTGLLREGQWSPDVASPDPVDMLAVLTKPSKLKLWGQPERRLSVTELLERYPEGATLEPGPMAVEWTDDEGQHREVRVADALPGWEWTAHDGTPHPIRYDEATDELVSDAQHTAVAEDISDELEQRRKDDEKRRILSDPEFLDDLLSTLPPGIRQKYLDRISAAETPIVIMGADNARDP